MEKERGEHQFISIINSTDCVFFKEAKHRTLIELKLFLKLITNTRRVIGENSPVV